MFRGRGAFGLFVMTVATHREAIRSDVRVFGRKNHRIIWANPKS